MHRLLTLTPLRALLLAAVLLAAQALGLAHGVVHGSAQGSSAASHQAGGFNGHDAGGTECGLFSQLLGQAHLPQASFQLPAPPAPAVAVAVLGALPRSAHGSAAYQARAPPRH